MSEARLRKPRSAPLWWIARHDLVDISRQRGTWFSLLVFPMLNVLLILVVPGLLTQREQAQQDTARYEVGIEATNTEDAVLVEQLLRGAAVTTERVDDAREAVGDRVVNVAVVVSPGAAEAFAGNGSAGFRLVALTTRNSSSRAFARVLEQLETRRVEQARRRAVQAGLPESAVQPLAFETLDVADSGRGAQLTLAGTLPLLVLLPLTSTIGIAAQRISGTRDTRVVEPLLVLPLAHHEVLAGKALSSLVLSLVAVPATTLPLLLARFVPVVGAGRSIDVGVGTVLAVAATAVVVLVVLVALGVYVGAAARTSTELSALLPYVTFPIVLLALTLQFFGQLSATPVLSLVPVLGATLLVRDVAGGVADPLSVGIVLCSHTIATVVLLALAGRTFGGAKSVLRPTS